MLVQSKHRLQPLGRGELSESALELNISPFPEYQKNGSRNQQGRRRNEPDSPLFEDLRLPSQGNLAESPLDKNRRKRKKKRKKRRRALPNRNKRASYAHPVRSLQLNVPQPRNSLGKKNCF